MDYSNLSEIKKYWLEQIAPNYFDMENTNNYQVGIFGYINEIIGNTAEDSFNAINIARREFYPVTAQYKQSLYKMAATQKIDLPMTTPASAKAILIFKEDEIISNGAYKNGVYTCIIDSSLEIMAGDIPFLLDYPIVIISKREGDKWIHTSHYQIDIENSLSDNPNRYIMNKTIIQSGVRYVLLSVSLKQLALESMSQLVVKDNIIDTVTMDFKFNGNLANFEVFYREVSGSVSDIQLKKVLKGGVSPNNPFCFYEIIDPNIIRLTFKRNVYFNLAFNSEIILNVYTSLGEAGTFEVFKDALTCTAKSEKYPYNNKMIITGKINGSSKGGVNAVVDEEFRKIITDAYSTNNTITTSNDLQIYFDKVARQNQDAQKTKVLFRKKRDDALIRLYGAYILLKDTYNNVVPTNTVDIQFWKNEIVEGVDSPNRLFIKPGTLFEYKPGDFTAKKVTDLTIVDDLNIYDDNSRFVFTNPFLIAITLDPNIIGYYLNSINNIKPIEYKYVNDNTLNQFIGSNLKFYRNSLINENFYKISMTISPASEIDPNTIVTVNPPTDANNVIRATKNGILLNIQYENDGVYANFLYDDATTQKIQVNNIIKKNIATGVFEYTTGYDIQIEATNKFIKNDIIAIKKDTDLGRIRVGLDFKNILYDNQYYIPFSIERYDSNLNSYDIAAYISTDDTLTLEAQLLIQHGIIDFNGIENDNVTIPMNQLDVEIHVFFNNSDTNYAHQYDNCEYFKSYTLTNTYSLDGTEENYKVSLIQQVDFIRSTMVYVDNTEDPDNFGILIKEVPVSKANWCKPVSNFRYLIDNIYDNYLKLSNTYYTLENNYGIDLKFFNTYGKSRFFRVGIKNTTNVLDSVNCSFSFGVYLTSLTSPNVFLTEFRQFVKDYIESINSVGVSGQSLYIMNLITNLKTKFSEIGYIEYYGLNSYSHEAQKIEGLSNAQIVASGITDYIPEFINIHSVREGAEMVPKIDILLLDS